MVGYTGFEPVTSALSRQRSKPTELISLILSAKLELIIKFQKQKKAAENGSLFEKSCGPYWIRTSDPLLVRQVL